MLLLGILLLLVAGAFLIVKRNVVTDLQRVAIGARLHPGCAVAEGVVVMAIAALMLVLYFRGWFEG